MSDIRIVDEVTKEAQHKMDNAVELFRSDIRGVRSGKASASLVENIQVDVYGAKSRIKELASISVNDRSILINAWDSSAVGAIKSAIVASSIGAPSVEGSSIRLNVPGLTEEHKHNLLSTVKKMAENAKVAIRNVRRHCNDKLDSAKSAKEISEDDFKRATKKLQEITDKSIEEIDATAARKSEEINS